MRLVAITDGFDNFFVDPSIIPQYWGERLLNGAPILLLGWDLATKKQRKIHSKEWSDFQKFRNKNNDKYRSWKHGSNIFEVKPDHGCDQDKPFHRLSEGNLMGAHSAW